MNAITQALRSLAGSADSGPSITFLNWTTRAESLKSPFKSLVEEFAPQLRASEIIIDDRNGAGRSTIDPIEDGKLRIYFWAMPSGVRRANFASNTLWGVRVCQLAGDYSITKPENTGPNTICDPAGNPVGEVVGNNIFIYHALPYYCTAAGADPNAGLTVFRSFLEAAVAYFRPLSPEEAAEQERRREEERLRIAEELRLEAVANPVVVKRWQGSQDLKEKFAAVAKELAPALTSKQICVYDYCHDLEVHPPAKDGRFHIVIWSSSDGTHGDGNMPHTVFGAPLAYSARNATATILRPTGAGGVVLVDDDGSQVGKLMNDTLYIHYPLTRGRLEIVWDGKGAEALFRRILEEAVTEMTATDEMKAERARHMAERVRARSREQYVSMCSGRFDRMLRDTRASIESGTQEIGRLQQELVTKIRTTEGLQRKLRQMESARPDDIASYGTEYDKLLATPKVVNVTARDGIVSVFTTTLYFRDSIESKSQGCEVRRKLGTRRIDIHTKGYVRWHVVENASTEHSYAVAPHVDAEGAGCLGNMQEVFPQLIARNEYADVAVLAIRFLESHNAGNEVNRPDKWPISDDWKTQQAEKEEAA